MPFSEPCAQHIRFKLKKSLQARYRWIKPKIVVLRLKYVLGCMVFGVSVNAVTDVALLEQDRILSLFLIVLGPLGLDVLLVVWVEQVGITATVFHLFYAYPSLC